MFSVLLRIHLEAELQGHMAIPCSSHGGTAKPCFHSAPLFIFHTAPKVTSLKFKTDHVTIPLKTLQMVSHFSWNKIQARYTDLYTMVPAPLSNASLNPLSSLLNAFCSCLRTFALALPSGWSALPPNLSMGNLLSALRPLLEHHLLREAFTYHLIWTSRTPPSIAAYRITPVYFLYSTDPYLNLTL